MAAPVRLGFLYPGYSSEDDYPRMRSMLEVPCTVDVVHTAMELDAHEEGALLDIGASEALGAGARVLKERGVDAGMWACTSGSFVFGWEGARRQVEEVEAFLGVPFSSTSWAFVHGLLALGVHRAAITATYPPPISERFREFLSHADVEIVAVTSQDVLTAAEVGTFEPDRVLSFVRAGDHPDAEVVLVPDTALHTAALVEDLERDLDKPVLTANQVTMWEALRLAGALRPQAGLGRLFRLETGD